MNFFKAPDQTFGGIGAEVLSHLIAAASDIALVVDKNGVIRDLALGDAALDNNNYNSWIGAPWIDTVTVESRPKVEQMLREPGSTPRPREINHRTANGEDMLIRYSSVRLGRGGDIVALGRDMRALAQLQQRLVDSQRSLEREYLRLRNAETRYRLIFQMSGEAIFIVDAASMKIADANPAAQNLLESTPGRLVGKPAADLFETSVREAALSALASVRSVGRIEGMQTNIAGHGRYFMAASLSRQDEAAQILLRLSPVAGAADTAAAHQRVGQIIDTMPDAFVALDGGRQILETNRAFLDLAGLTNPAQAIGQHVERWLGRSGAEANVLFSQLEEHGALRDFSTVLRNDYGVSETVDVAGVIVPDPARPLFGLVIRRAPRLSGQPMTRAGKAARSEQQLSELIGRVPLKELVRETTELTERMCIEASLRLTGDNRAAAAQMLGLSRQGLYDKLRRYNIGDLGESQSTSEPH